MVPLTLYCLVAVLAVEQLVLHLAGTAALESLRLAAFALGAGALLLMVAAFAAWRLLESTRRTRQPSKQASPTVPGDRSPSSWLILAAPLSSLLCVGCCALAAGSIASLQAVYGASAATRLSSSSVSSWRLVVTSDPSLTQTGYRCRCRVRADGVEVGDFWVTGQDRFARGETLRCVGRFRPLQDDEWGDTCRRQGVWGSITCVRALERTPATGATGALGHLRAGVSASFDPSSSDARALLDACVTGTRDAMAERGTDEVFRTCGVAHLVAVSGSHLSVVVSVLGAVLVGLGHAPKARTILLSAAAGLFVVFCGAPVSAVRAWVMVVISGGSVFAGRRGHGLSSVCLVALVMALANPALSGQLGFVLSVSSVAGLCLFSRYASYALGMLLPSPRLLSGLGRRTAKARGHLWRSMCDALGATLVAQTATAPFTARAFGDVSLVAPLANLAVGPLFTVLVSLGLVAACLVGVPGLQWLVLLAADAVGQVVLLVLNTLASVPCACLSLGDAAIVPAAAGVVVMAVLLALWPPVRPKLVWGAASVLLACACVVFVRWRWFAPPRICVLDVGQGDAVLVQDGGSALLVDAGPEGAVVSALIREHVMHLDAVSITHLHDDHYGGVLDLAGAVACDRVYVGEGARQNEPSALRESIRELTGEDAEELRYGDTLVVGGFELRVVSPRGQTSGKENGDSVVMAVTYRGVWGTLAALLTGDAEKDELAVVLDDGDVGDIDFLKVGHHGSEVSLTREQAAALDPEVSVASAGEGNSYGHPRQECVDALTSADSWFLCTKDVGTVEIRPAAEGLRVVCERAP